MQNVEIPHHASLLAGTVLGYLERLQIEAVEQYYIFNDSLSIMSYPYQGLSTPKATIGGISPDFQFGLHQGTFWRVPSSVFIRGFECGQDTNPI